MDDDVANLHVELCLLVVINFIVRQDYKIHGVLYVRGDEKISNHYLIYKNMNNVTMHLLPARES